MTVEGFQVNSENRAAFEVVQAFDYQTSNMYLYGRCGVGKTHLAAIVLRRLFGEGRQVELVQPAGLIRSTRGREGYEEEQTLERLARVDCLVIDELGAERSTEYALQLLYEVVNRRWLRDRNGLIVTSNLSLRDLASKVQDDRLLSRLAGLCRVISVGGQDWRRRHGV
jgi:DNA replication protein DnaC